LGAVVLFGGLAYPVTGVAAEHTTAGIISVARGVGGGILIVALLPLFGAHLPRSGRDWLIAAAIGVGNTTLTLVGIAEATARAGPAVASVLLNSSTLIAAAVAWAALGERLSPVRTAGLLCGFAGVVIVVLADPGDVGSGGSLAIGLALALVGALGWALSGLAVRSISTRRRDLDLLGFSAAQFLVGGVLLVPVALWSGDPGSTDWSSPALWWSLAFLVVLGHTLVYVCFNAALARMPSARVYSVQFLVPLVAVAVEALRGNLPSTATVVGIVVAIAGVAVVTAPGRPAR
jgi:drug/metabolite transporter (DMT)-like permease